MKDRRLYDFFNDRFERALQGSATMVEAYDTVTREIWENLNFVPYKNFESFIRLRKAKKKTTTGKKSPVTTDQ